ncbi:MAG: O-antigen ligase family protein [Pyrinomonadaceae bacterium]
MAEFLEKLDSLAGIETENKRARFLERIAFVFLTIMVLAMPHSIAATQTAWLIGMLAWVIRLFMKPRQKLVRTPLNIAFSSFFGWSAVSSVFSYAPDISIDKLRNVSLFLIFFFVANNLRSRRAAIFLAFTLIFSCMVNVVWTPIDRLIGRGVEIHGIAPESPLAKALLQEGDAVLRADGKKLKTPEDLVSEIEKNETSKVEFYRPDFYTIVEVKKSDLLSGTNSLEKLGVTSWKKSHNWRSAGFYGHYATYAEVLQLIASLVFGLFIAFLTNRRKDAKTQKLLLILFVCLLAMSLALLLTVTRASQLAFMISAFSIVLLGGNRKIILILSAIALPLVIGGLIFLQTSRNVGFFDRTDNSTTWRTTVWREGFNLWTESARNFTLGVGMDSIKRYAKDWRLFDDGKLPMGHFHSTPLQLVVERGFPALLLWLWILFIYAKTLIRGITNYELRITNSEENSALSKGVLLGCFGGLVGFFTSGLVHYNLGDAEVAMVFFLLMGLGIKLTQQNE